MSLALLSLGSNIGDRKAMLSQAVAELSDYKATSLIATSSIYRSLPYGKTDQPDFYNMVISLQTKLSPEELFIMCEESERRLGRIRQEARWGPRVIDIDLIYIDDLVFKWERFELPHADRLRRSFVMTPLAEIVPHFIDPVIHKTISEIAQEIPDTLQLTKLPNKAQIA